MLYSTKIELFILNTIELIDFFQSTSIRGGVSTVCDLKRMVANNKLMLKDYNPSIPDNFILYFDITNLYGMAMTFPLPYF
jgi:hypothetical protein